MPVIDVEDQYQGALELACHVDLINAIDIRGMVKFYNRLDNGTGV